MKENSEKRRFVLALRRQTNERRKQIEKLQRANFNCNLWGAICNVGGEKVPTMKPNEQ